MANVTRYNPFDDFFSDFGKRLWLKPVALPDETELRMKIDVKEDEKAYTVKADIPGVKKEDIQVDIDDDQVSIRAEVKQEKEEKSNGRTLVKETYVGSASRGFSLANEIDEKAVSAKLEDGVLKLTLPKRAGAGARAIAIE